MIRRLPETTHLLYTELLDGLLHAAHSKRGISFHKKNVRGSKHWYLEYVLGASKRAFYLGPDSPDVRERVAAAKHRWQEESPDATRRARLVSMLVAGGASTVAASHARVLEALEQAGVFLVGGVLVGSHAFTLMANLLGVKWSRTAMRTQDVDIAADKIAVTVPEVKVDIEKALVEADKGFFAVPSLSRDQPATSFKVRGKDISVSLLTPMVGKPDARPRFILALNAMAEPLRFLDYLLDELQPTVVPVRQGVLVNIPSPARFALHKLVVSQRRPPAFAEKTRKDIAQASAVIEVLLEDRPGDLLQAADAARSMPPRFVKQMSAGVAQLPERVRDLLYQTADIGMKDS